MDLSRTYLDNHFTIYVNQTTMLYTFNLYSYACQLFLNKTGIKNYPVRGNRIFLDTLLKKVFNETKIQFFFLSELKSTTLKVITVDITDIWWLMLCSQESARQVCSAGPWLVGSVPPPPLPCCVVLSGCSEPTVSLPPAATPQPPGSSRSEGHMEERVGK